MQQNNQLIINRLKEYKVDFLYSKNVYYKAAQRIRKKNQAIIKRRKTLAIVSIILSVFALSSIALFLTEHTQIGILVISFCSLGAVAIDIILLSNQEKENEHLYQQKAEKYNDLFKHIKNIEALFNEGHKDIDFVKELEKITREDEEVRKTFLIVDNRDYELASKEIKNGGADFTPEELEK